MRFRTGKPDPLEPEYIEPGPVPGLKIGFIRVPGNPGLGPLGPGKPGLKSGTGFWNRNHF